MTISAQDVVDVPEGVMGRAGLIPQGARAFAATPHGITSGFHLPDLSEFNNSNWSGITGENGGGAVIRALYGTSHIDNAWAAGRRALAHNAGVSTLGIYQYLRADQDVIAQARAFVALVGSLQDGEFAILDHEEGGGNQLSRAIAWLATVGTLLPAYPGYSGNWLYSGLNFAMTAGLSPIFTNPQVHTWVAAYGQSEPTLPHTLWQHSNGQIGNCTYEPWAGTGFVDCSSRPGGLSDLAALITGGNGQSTGTTEDNDMQDLNNGTGAQTIYKWIGGSAGGMAFGCNATDVGANSPYLKVATYNNNDKTWTRDRIRVPADTTQNDGQVSYDFPDGGAHITMISVIRDSHGSADNVAVGVNVY
jgi:hypothetical protein